MPAVYLHFEQASPEFTLKLAYGLSSSPWSVRQALSHFCEAYATTGSALPASKLSLAREDGVALSENALLPCGLPPGSDLFVHCPSQPTAAEPSALAAALTALRAAGREEEQVESNGPTRVFAKQGSAIAASQAKMGENSYYYSVGKVPGAASSAPPVAPVAVVKVAADSKSLPEVTISSYSLIDDDAKVKIIIPMAGAASLPEGAISAVFRDRSFDLRVLKEGKCFRLHIPILLEEINQEACCCKKRQGKLLLVLEKRDPSKSWYELRKTKGIGDTEYHKIVPDSGDTFEFKL
ncbi:MAG: hypothetical protein SGPRY_007211 [Prymnesium sp.]